MDKKKKSFDKNIIALIANSAMHKIIVIYMNTFLVAYLLNVSSGNFYNVALYYLITYLVLLVAYTFFSFIVCKVEKVKMVRIGVIFHCLLLTSIAILKDRIVDYLVPISVIYSISNALYWSALNSLSNETIKGRKLQGYSTYNVVFQNLTSIIVPIVFGSIIDSSSLSVISVFVSIVGLLQIIATFFLTKSTIVHKKLDLKGYYNNCYNKNHKRCFNLLYLGYISYGCKEGVTTLITMLIVLTFKTNTSLGAISSIISLLTVLLLIISNKSKNKSRNGIIYINVTMITIISMILLIFDLSRPMIIFFNLCDGALLSLVYRSYSVKRSGLIKAIGKKEYIIEHQATIEVFLNIGRIIFYSILLLASFTTEIWVYKMLLALSICVVCFYGLTSYFLEKEYNKILIEREFKKQRLPKEEDMDYLIPCYSNPNVEFNFKIN